MNKLPIFDTLLLGLNRVITQISLYFYSNSVVILLKSCYKNTHFFYNTKMRIKIFALFISF